MHRIELRVKSWHEYSTNSQVLFPLRVRRWAARAVCYPLSGEWMAAAWVICIRELDSIPAGPLLAPQLEVSGRALGNYVLYAGERKEAPPRLLGNFVFGRDHQLKPTGFFPQLSTFISLRARQLLCSHMPLFHSINPRVLVYSELIILICISRLQII